MSFLLLSFSAAVFLLLLILSLNFSDAPPLSHKTHDNMYILRQLNVLSVYLSVYLSIYHISQMIPNPTLRPRAGPRRLRPHPALSGQERQGLHLHHQLHLDRWAELPTCGFLTHPILTANRFFVHLLQILRFSFQFCRFESDCHIEFTSCSSLEQSREHSKV